MHSIGTYNSSCPSMAVDIVSFSLSIDTTVLSPPASLPSLVSIPFFNASCTPNNVCVLVQSDAVSRVGYVVVQLIFPYPCLKFLFSRVWYLSLNGRRLAVPVLFTTTVKFFYPPHLPHWIILYSEYFPRAVCTFLTNPPNSFYCMPCVIWQLTFVPRLWFIT